MKVLEMIKYKIWELIFVRNKSNYKLLRNLNFLLLGITFTLAFTQIKLNNYNSKIDDIDDNLTNKVISGIYSNHLHLQENLISNKLFNAIVHEKLEVVSKLEQEILQKRIEITRNYYSISELPKNIQLEKLIKNDQISYEEKYNRLLKIYRNFSRQFK